MDEKELRDFYVKTFEQYPDVVDLPTFREMLGGVSDKFARRLMREGIVKSFMSPAKRHMAYHIPKSCVVDYVMSDGYQSNKHKLKGQIRSGLEADFVMERVPANHAAMGQDVQDNAFITNVTANSILCEQREEPSQITAVYEAAKRKVPERAPIIYAVANQKGGVGKTTLTLNLGACLTRMGYRVCLVDADPQSNMTMALGCQQPDELPVTLPHIIHDIIKAGLKLDNTVLTEERGYIQRSQGMDLIPSSIELTGIENVLLNTMNRENVLKKFINHIKNDYDFVLIDCMPSLNFITINALTAANRVLIPVQPQYFSARGLELLLQTIANVRENLNPKLMIEGALITMFDNRLGFQKEVVETVTTAYGGHFRIFDTKIPMSVRVTEAQASGQSIFDSDSKGKVAKAYGLFAKELIGNE